MGGEWQRRCFWRRFGTAIHAWAHGVQPSALCRLPCMFPARYVDNGLKAVEDYVNARRNHE